MEFEYRLLVNDLGSPYFEDFESLDGKKIAKNQILPACYFKLDFAILKAQIAFGA